jgi:hypothetical protein
MLLWACATFSANNPSQPAELLVPRLLESLRARMRGCAWETLKPQALATVGWAGASLGWAADDELLRRVAEETWARLQSRRSAYSACSGFSGTRTSRSGPEQPPSQEQIEGEAAIARAQNDLSAAPLGESKEEGASALFKPQELANLAWAFARSGVAGSAGPFFFRWLAVVIRGPLPKTDPRQPSNITEITNVSWLGCFKLQELSTLLWACATRVDDLGELAPDLFDAAARELLRRDLRGLPVCPSLPASFATWSLTSSQRSHPPANAKAAKARERHILSHQALANILWAFASAGVRHDALMQRLAEELLRRPLADFSFQALGNSAWAFARLGVVPALLFSKLAAEVARRYALLGAASFSLDPFLGPSPGLFAGAQATARADQATEGAQANKSVSESVSPQFLANVMWAFAVADQPLSGVLPSMLRRLGPRERLENRVANVTQQALLANANDANVPGTVAYHGKRASGDAENARETEGLGELPTPARLAQNLLPADPPAHMPDFEMPSSATISAERSLSNLRFPARRLIPNALNEPREHLLRLQTSVCEALDALGVPFEQEHVVESLVCACGRQ